MNTAALLTFFLIYPALIAIGLYLAFKLVFAIVRMSHALDSASHSLEVIAAKIEQKPPQQ